MPFERELRDAEIIERWGTVRMHRRGNVGAHSHRVVIYSDQIATLIEWQGDRAALMRWAAWHDMPEVVTGDVPGPAKARFQPGHWDEMEMDGVGGRFDGNEWCQPADTEVVRIVKLADVLDQILACTVEMSMGNQLLDLIYYDANERLRAARKAIDFGYQGTLDAALVRAVAMHRKPPHIFGSNAVA